MSAMRRISAACKAALIAAGLCVITAPSVVSAQLVDPTRPPDYLAPGTQQEAGPQETGTFPSSPWDLTSTLVSPRRTLAVINGQVVTKGSKIGDMTVAKIGRGEVVLVGGGRTEVINLVGQDVKKPVSNGEQ